MRRKEEEEEEERKKEKRRRRKEEEEEITCTAHLHNRLVCRHDTDHVST